uniref:substrate-binding periplasmic protein n=1 Tax=Aneurinibacillus tyrosinisolvens TaxID=1443435 RepID=UPI00063F3523
VVIADNAYLLAQLAKDPKEGYRIIDDPTIPKEDYGIMVNLKDTELMKQIDDTMQKLRDNGVYDELYKKYFPDKK